MNIAKEPRPVTIAFKVTYEERDIVRRLAAHEERVPSDIMRRLIRAAAVELPQQSPPQPAPGAQ